MLIALAAALPFFVSNYHVFELTMVMIYTIAVLGLNILTGYNGQISLGHGAFFAAWRLHHRDIDAALRRPLLGHLPPAGLICFVLGVLFGLPALRFEGPYLALVTLSMALAMPQLLKYFDTWTGGVQGINLVKVAPPSGTRHRPRPLALSSTCRGADSGDPRRRQLAHGRTGRALVAIRDHPIAAAAMGIDNARYKTLAFGISTLFTGVAGSLAAIVVSYRLARGLTAVPVDRLPGRIDNRGDCDD